MQSPHTFSRGNFSRSINMARSPAAAQNAAQVDPAGPPPTIATSTISIRDSFNCEAPVFNTCGARSKQERESVYELVHSDPACCGDPVTHPRHLSFVNRLG